MPFDTIFVFQKNSVYHLSLSSMGNLLKMNKKFAFLIYERGKFHQLWKKRVISKTFNNYKLQNQRSNGGYQNKGENFLKRFD